MKTLLPSVLTLFVLCATAQPCFADTSHLYIVDRLGFLISMTEVICDDAPEEYDAAALSLIRNTTLAADKGERFANEYRNDRKDYNDRALQDPTYLEANPQKLAVYCERLRKERTQVLDQARALDTARPGKKNGTL